MNTTKLRNISIAFFIAAMMVLAAMCAGMVGAFEDPPPEQIPDRTARITGTCASRLVDGGQEEC